VLFLCLFPHSAFSSLILDGTVSMSGMGKGAAPALLTIKGPAGSSAESGCVAWNGLIDVIGTAACAGTGAAGGNEQAGASRTLTRSLAETGITSASDLRIVLNAREPGGESVLTELFVTIFDDGGDPLFTSGPLGEPVILPKLHGQTSFVFRLDNGDLVEVPIDAFSNPSNRIGITATVNSAMGGREKFFAVSGDALDPPPPETPEPCTLLSVAAGLVAVWFLSRLRPARKAGLEGDGRSGSVDSRRREQTSYNHAEEL
jgi:hypothetical protein